MRRIIRPLSRLILAGLILCMGTSVSLALTVSEIRSAVRRNVRDTASSTSLRRYSDAIILNYINEAQRAVINDTWASSDSTTDSLVAGTTYYSVPDESIQVWRVTVDGANLPELTLAQLDADNYDINWSTGGTPRAFFLDRAEQTLIGLQPFPLTSGGGLKIFYYQRVPDLALDADVPFDSDVRLFSYHDLIVYHASFRILLSENRTSEAEYYAKLYDAAVDLMNINVGHKPQRAMAPAQAVKP